MRKPGERSGDLPADVDPDLAAPALVGPVVYCRLMTGAPFPVDRIDSLLDLVLGRG